ncbi:hypothetical protein ABZ557_23865 [Streptomyces sp. NPDC019645]|uniref:hypothetical protein n=1 Tax=Streptomyces sp. NPDC019645 TaxID=3154786 RepID=UPI00340C253D
MLLHEGALVTYGPGVLPDPFGAAREQARALLAAAPGPRSDAPRDGFAPPLPGSPR